MLSSSAGGCRLLPLVFCRRVSRGTCGSNLLHTVFDSRWRGAPAVVHARRLSEEAQEESDPDDSDELRVLPAVRRPKAHSDQVRGGKALPLGDASACPGLQRAMGDALRNVRNATERGPADDWIRRQDPRRLVGGMVAVFGQCASPCFTWNALSLVSVCSPCLDWRVLRSASRRRESPRCAAGPRRRVPVHAGDATRRVHHWSWDKCCPCVATTPCELRDPAVRALSGLRPGLINP